MFARQYANILRAQRRSCQESEIDDLVEQRLTIAAGHRLDQRKCLVEPISLCEFKNALPMRIGIPRFAIDIRKITWEAGAVSATPLVAKQACLQSVTPGPLIVFPYAGSRQGWIEGIGRPGLTLGDSIGPHHIADVESRGGVISHGEIADSFNDALEQPDLILTDPDREQDAATRRDLPEDARRMDGKLNGALPPDPRPFEEVNAMGNVVGEVGLAQRHRLHRLGHPLLGRRLRSIFCQQLTAERR